MEIKYHQYEISRDGLNGNEFRVLNERDKNWVLIDKSSKEKIIIHSGEKIDDLLNDKKINYVYQGLKSCERKEIKIISS